MKSGGDYFIELFGGKDVEDREERRQSVNGK